LPRHFITGTELSPDEIQGLIERALELKAAPSSSDALRGRTVALIFQKPSTRTRVSFEVGIAELGGHPMVLRPDELQLSRGESVRDTAYVLSRHVAAIGIRTADEDLVAQMAEHATVPVINMLTPRHHPCQALADLLTLREAFGRLRGLTVAYVGDGNNVAASLAQAVAMLGGQVIVASPAGFELPASVIDGVMSVARFGGGVTVTNDPIDAVRSADAIYTDVWASMGQEGEATERRAIFAPYQVNAALVDKAPDGAIFMHCLPAHRGDEVTDEVIDSPISVVFDQSENRLHTQKALLALLAS
jgi:ornithine carbamoyltransferase